MNVKLQYSPEFVEQMHELREELHSGTIAHLRLTGEPGVGKTRLALELTRALSQVTLFVREGRSLLQSTFLNELLEPENNRFAILVVDECPPKDREEIWNRIKRRSNRLRLISIDHCPENAHDDQTRVFEVKPIGIAHVKAIIAGYGIEDLDAERWAEDCEGSPRVAHVIGENLRQNRSDVLQSPAIVNVWDRFIVGTDDPNSEAVSMRRIVLEHIALFERFGFEPPVEQEARFIAEMARGCDHRVTWPKFQSTIARLKDRRIVQGVTTLYITPRALHKVIYRDFWENYGSGFDIAAVWREMPESMWSWFFSMLKYAHTSHAASHAVDRLFSPDGAFSTDIFPDNESTGRLMMTVAESNRRPVLKYLQRTIGKETAKRLRNFRRARQFVVWALERIAVWEDTFKDGAELLLVLAEAENATNSNNATGTFVSLFNLAPGMAATQASASMRLDFLRAVLASKSAERRAIGLRAAEAALSTMPTGRVVGPEHQGLRQTIEFWAPKTYGELWDAMRDVWQLLVKKLDQSIGEERAELIRTLIRSARSIFHIHALRLLVLETLEPLVSDPQIDVKELVLFIRTELRHRVKHPEPINKQLGNMLLKLEGVDFPSKLRRYVKDVTTEDSFDENFQRIDFVERKLDELAAEGMASRDLLIKELDWLVAENSSTTFCLGFRIEKLDPKHELLSELVVRQQAVTGEAAPTFLCGYLGSIFNRDRDEWQATLLALAHVPMIQRHFVDLVFGSGMTDVVGRRLIELLESTRCDVSRLERYWFSDRLRQIDESVFLKLIDLQLDQPQSNSWSNAVHMFHTYYRGEGDNRQVPEHETFRLLTRPLRDGTRAGHMVSYYWSGLAASFIAQYPGRTWELFAATLRLGQTHWSVVDDLDFTNEQIITQIFESDPTRAWRCITESYSEANDQMRFGIQHWLSDDNHRLAGDNGAGLISAVPADIVFDWLDEDFHDRAHWLIGTLPKTLDTNHGGSITREFLARYGDDEICSSSLWCRLNARSWCGLDSDHYRHLRTQAQEWLIGEKNPSVVRWVDKYVELLTAQIERAEIEEERE